MIFNPLPPSSVDHVPKLSHIFSLFHCEGGRVVQFPKVCHPSSTMFAPQKQHWATYIDKDLYSIIFAKLKQMSTDVNLQSKI